METVFIYSLSTIEEPNKIRYVGKTDNIEDRIKSHTCNSALKEKTHKAFWLKSAIKKGHTPKIDFIDEVLESEWQYWEKHWIAQFKMWGFKLTNLTPGGDGVILSKDNLKKRNKTMRDKHTERLQPEIIKYNIKEVDEIWTSEHICKKCGKTVVFQQKNRSLILKATRQAIKKESVCSNCNKKGRPSFFKGKKHSEETTKYLKNLRPKKAVNMYSLDGILINKFLSLKEASRNTGIDVNQISGCCHDKPGYYTANGYIFKFNEEPFKYNTYKNTHCKSVIQKDKFGNTIKEFNSVIEASMATGIQKTNISSCCRKRNKTAGGFIWEYKSS